MIQNQLFDMILLDIDMPEMDGFQFLKEIITLPKLSDVPIIVTSAIDKMDNVAKCIEIGAEDYLIKPVNEVLLKARVDSSLEKKRLRDQHRELLQKVEIELKIAEKTQEGILPDHNPEIAGYDIGSLMIPARVVSGDFYDFFPLENNKYGFAIGDVADKGLPAALVMTLTYGLVRVEVSLAEGPKQVLSNVNRQFCRIDKSGYFVTLLYGSLDCTTGEFLFSRAGHPAPVIFDEDGIMIEMDDLHGISVGVIEEPIYLEQRTTIPPGGTVIMYSDGLSEAMDVAGNQFSIEGIVRTCSCTLGCSAQEICQHLFEAASHHISNMEQLDDFTVLVIKRKAA
jgi:phosphoserine phosphatase RsbU/P